MRRFFLDPSFTVFFTISSFTFFFTISSFTVFFHYFFISLLILFLLVDTLYKDFQRCLLFPIRKLFHHFYHLLPQHAMFISNYLFHHFIHNYPQATHNFHLFKEAQSWIDPATYTSSLTQTNWHKTSLGLVAWARWPNTPTRKLYGYSTYTRIYCVKKYN